MTRSFLFIYPVWGAFPLPRPGLAGAADRRKESRPRAGDDKSSGKGGSGPRDLNRWPPGGSTSPARAAADPDRGGQGPARPERRGARGVGSASRGPGSRPGPRDCAPETGDSNGNANRSVNTPKSTRKLDRGQCLGGPGPGTKLL